MTSFDLYLAKIEHISTMVDHLFNRSNKNYGKNKIHQHDGTLFNNKNYDKNRIHSTLFNNKNYGKNRIH